MHDKYQEQRIADCLEATAFNLQNFQQDLAESEARVTQTLLRYCGKSPVAYTLAILDSICRAKHSGRLTTEQLDALNKLLPKVLEITRYSGRLAKLGVHLKPSILKELAILGYEQKPEG
jgi:hypothetical protein